MRIVRRDDCLVQPWKNGGGTSRRIAALPPDAGYDALDWHVSRPSIGASGPFSHLPGLDRQFMIVAGRGVVLHCRGDGADVARRIEHPLESFAFRGDWDVACELIDGPVEALNVMTRRARWGASVETLPLAAAPSMLRKPQGEALIAWCASGPVTAYGSWGTATLDRDDSVVVDEAPATEIALAAAAAPASIVLIRVNPT